VESELVTADPALLTVKFTQEESHQAFDAWGFNCGPSAIAAVVGLTIDEVRPHMGDFESKHYTNPTLNRSGSVYRCGTYASLRGFVHSGHCGYRRPAVHQWSVQIVCAEESCR
jgi:hypothetical protein